MHKVGIIGFGKMGQIRAQAIEEISSEVISIYDPEHQENIKYNVANSPEDIICDPLIDSVFICTPNYLNKNLTIQSLNAGKNVFCEKPPALNAAEIEEVITAEKNNSGKLMYGFNHRHHYSIKKAKELIDSEEFGKVLWMRGRYGKSVDSSFFDNWRSEKKLSGGGILIDQGIHMLDLFLYFAGNFHESHAFVSNQYWGIDGIEDNVFGIFKNYDTGLVASLHSTMTQWRHLFSLELFLEKGYLVINGLKTSSGTYGNEVLTIARNRTSVPKATWEQEERIEFPIDDSWALEIKHFFEAIESGINVVLGTSRDALTLMKLIDEIYKPKQHLGGDYGY